MIIFAMILSLRHHCKYIDEIYSRVQGHVTNLTRDSLQLLQAQEVELHSYFLIPTRSWLQEAFPVRWIGRG